MEEGTNQSKGFPENDEMRTPNDVSTLLNDVKLGRADINNAKRMTCVCDLSIAPY